VIHIIAESETSQREPVKTGSVFAAIMLSAAMGLSACGGAPLPSRPVPGPDVVTSLDATADEETALGTIDGAIEAAATAAEPDAPLLLPVPAPEAKPPARGLFGFLRRNEEQAGLATPQPVPDPAQTTLAGLGPTDPNLAPATQIADPGNLPTATGPVELIAAASLDQPPKQTLSNEEITALALVEPEKAETVKRAGLFGCLRNRAPAPDPAARPLAADPYPEEDTESLVLAAAAPAPENPRGGLAEMFSMRAEAAAPPNPQFDPNATNSGLAPFGDVVKVCGVPTREFGAEVARSGGSGAFRLYDTEPVSTLQRAQFLTGFKDGCARRFTGALALFGNFDVHEAKRYSKSNKTPYSTVDRAYEKLKSQICGVGRGKPCPEKKAERLYREVTFVTVYRAFGGADEWMELMLHKGDLVSYATLDP